MTTRRIPPPGEGEARVGVPRRYVLDRWARRSSDHLMISGGAPSRVVRLTTAGANVLDAALAGHPPSGHAARRLLSTLMKGGLIHPSGVLDPPAVAPATAIVPVRDGARWLAGLVATLRTCGDVIVVDDGSADGSPGVARAAGATVLRNRHAPGPSGARNTGLGGAGSELVAFVDHDCVVTPGWSNHLIGLFEDPLLALAAPRVRSLASTSRLARYERACSPLDMGAHPALVGPGRRVGYVPSAALVGRRSALLGVGGFDPELSLGEDVDLVWRLIEAGWTVRYAPESEVHHRPRATVAGMARQRFSYGWSAPLLERRHPGAAAPLAAAPHTMGIWLAGASLGPAAAGAGIATSVLAGASTVRDANSRRQVASIVALGHMRATRHLMRVVVREWLPVTALACIWSRRARRIAAVAIAVDALVSRGRDPDRLDVASHLAFRSVDLAAYCAGLWRASLRERSVAALTLRFALRGRDDSGAADGGPLSASHDDGSGG